MLILVLGLAVTILNKSEKANVCKVIGLMAITSIVLALLFMPRFCGAIREALMGPTMLNI